MGISEAWDESIDWGQFIASRLNYVGLEIEMEDEVGVENLLKSIKWDQKTNIEI